MKSIQFSPKSRDILLLLGKIVKKLMLTRRLWRRKWHDCNAHDVRSDTFIIRNVNKMLEVIW